MEASRAPATAAAALCPAEAVRPAPPWSWSRSHPRSRSGTRTYRPRTGSRPGSGTPRPRSDCPGSSIPRGSSATSIFPGSYRDFRQIKQGARVPCRGSLFMSPVGRTGMHAICTPADFWGKSWWWSASRRAAARPDLHAGFVFDCFWQTALSLTKKLLVLVSHFFFFFFFFPLFDARGGSVSLNRGYRSWIRTFFKREFIYCRYGVLNMN